MILGSDFNSSKKLLVLDKIKSKSNVLTYFDLKKDTIKNVNNVLSYDLTHSIGNFLHNIEVSDFIDGNRKKAIKDDLIISRLRSYLKEIAVVQHNEIQQVFSSEYLVYRPKTKLITSNTLMVFCLTKYVQTILNYSQSGSAHPRFFEFVLNELPVPKVLISINKAIDTLLNKAYELRSQSIKSYKDAKGQLLKKIELENFESKKTNNFQEINLSKSFGSTTRLDAEYYHPKPLFLIEQLKKKEYYLVKNIFDIGNGYAWKSKYFKEQGEGEPFVRIRNCKPGYIDNNTLTTLDSDYAKGEEVEKAKENDIVIGMDGIKYFYGSLIKKPVYVNQRVCHLTPKEDSEIDSELVLMIINSVIGQTQLMREMTIAQTVGHITNASIGNLIIPKLDKKISNEVSAKIKESHKLEKESLHLLEVAKKAVEIAIEENEETALQYIKLETSQNQC